MTLSYVNTLRTAIVDLIVDSVDGGTGPGSIQIRSGTRPANAETGATGTLLAEVTLESPGFGAGSVGVATIADPDAVVGVADGVATWFRALDGDAATCFDGSVTQTGGGGDLTLATTSISPGLSIDITGGTITVPA